LTYTEGELLTIYEDVLSVSEPQTAEQNQRAALNAIKKAQVEDDLRVIKSLENRFFDEAQEHIVIF
jgi:hypothetical protein